MRRRFPSESLWGLKMRMKRNGKSHCDSSQAASVLIAPVTFCVAVVSENEKLQTCKSSFHLSAPSHA